MHSRQNYVKTQRKYVVQYQYIGWDRSQEEAKLESTANRAPVVS